MISKLAKNLSPLCWLPSGKLVCYQYGKLIILEGNKQLASYSLFSSKKEMIVGRIKPLFRLLRLGIRAAIAIDESHIVISIGNILHEVDLANGKLSKGFFCGEGVRPLSFTTVNDIDNFDDGIYFGGYVGSFLKNPIHVYKRIGVDQWGIVYTFPQGEIDHIHEVIVDPYRMCLWIFTGDFGDAAGIWKVEYNFNKVTPILRGSQNYRSCVAFATPEGVIYATDTPFQDNFIYLMSESGELKIIQSINGSCIYGCQWKDKYVFSSTVELDGRNNTLKILTTSYKWGTGIKDSYAHLYVGSIANGFTDVYMEKKDFWPPLFQFASFHFPAGKNDLDMLFFQPVATNKNDLTLLGYKE